MAENRKMWGDHDPEALEARNAALRGKPFLTAAADRDQAVLDVAAAGVQEWHDGWAGESDTSVGAATAALQALYEQGYTITKTYKGTSDG
jgi:hypothetical protein